MSTMPGETERIAARSVEFHGDCMHVTLQDGRVIHVPVNAYDRLRNATPAQRDAWELIAQDTGIHWEEIDEDLSVRGLVRDFAGPQHSAAVSETASKKSSPHP
jgi:hypothetical protein